MLETPAPTAAPDAVRPAPSPRLAWLDVLRGIALCGIIFVNVPQLWHLPDGVVDLVVQPTKGFLDLWVHGRFFPIFSWLFGLGFGLMWISAGRRSTQPRRALAQRIAVLAVLGLAHRFLQPGEALLPYAVAAAVLLLPSTWAPRWLPLAAGAVLTLVGAPFGGLVLIPGLFLVGFGAAQFGLPAFLDRRPWVAALALIPLVPAAWFVAQLQLADPLNAGFSEAGAITGLLMAASYAAAVVAATGLPVVGHLLRAVFTPLGRLALTNYIGATLLLKAVDPLRALAGLPTDGEAGWHVAMLTCAGILVAQTVFSAVWLRYRGQGPLEALWRRLTWWGVPSR